MTPSNTPDSPEAILEIKRAEAFMLKNIGNDVLWIEADSYHIDNCPSERMAKLMVQYGDLRYRQGMEAQQEVIETLVEACSTAWGYLAKPENLGDIKIVEILKEAITKACTLPPKPTTK